MAFSKVSLVAFLVVLAVALSQVDGYCYANESFPYTMYSTKTAYDAVRGTAGSDSKCEPIQMWLLSRHGTRYAKQSTLLEMKDLGIKLQTGILQNYVNNRPPQSKRLCDEDLRALREWKWDESIEDFGNFLTTEGWRELTEIAQRYQQRYPHLMSDYSDGKMYFRHTDEQRTWASCRAFVNGLFGSYEGVPIDDVREVDLVIRPYKECPPWIEAVDDNDDFKKAEKRIFRKEEDYLRLLDDVSERLGFSKNLKKDDIDAMYDLCRYEMAWYPNVTSPWCAVFRKYEVFLMEYYEDMATYYKSGYSHEFHPMLGCMPLKDLLEVFEDTVQNKEVKTNGIFYFTHDTMVNMFMTALGYNKDDQPLKGAGYKNHLAHRKFKSSLSTPFGAHVMAVLYKCSDNDYEVQLFNNEKPMELEGCPKGLCTWDYFKSKYGSAKSCNIDFCNQ